MKEEIRTKINLEKAANLSSIRWRENSIATLTVARTSPFGAFLSAETGNSSDDILLHEAQQTYAVREGERVRVFLYHDPRHRLTASMRLPKLELGEIGYAPVMSATRFGAFVDVGTERGIFLPYSEMIGRPEEGETVWVKLYEDKSGRLAVTMHVEEEMQALAQPAYGIKVGGKVEGTVYNIIRQGAFIITREKWMAFLHASDMPVGLRAGQQVVGRVTYIREDGRLNISLRATKEKMLESDAECLLAYMRVHGGYLPCTDASDPSDIKARLGISKAAFKRAAGRLMKEGVAVMTDDGLSLKESLQ